MAREPKRLTKAMLDGLRRKAQADPGFTAFVADAGQPGLYAWARRGRVRFVFAYRPAGGGRRRRISIDDYGAIDLTTARKVARQHRNLVAEGKDPELEGREEARRAMTVGEALDLYLEDFRQRAESGAMRGRRSSYEEAKRLLDKRVRPALGSLRLRAVSVDQVQRLHRSMKETPSAANRAVSALSAVYGFADQRQLVPAHFNPCRHVAAFAEKGERRALTADELAALGQAMREADKAGTVHPSALLALRLFALTGLRRSELLGHESKKRRGKLEGLRWGDVDLEAGTLRLRQSKTGAQTRVIGQAAIELLREVKPHDVTDEEPVCPGTQTGRPFIGIDRPRIRLFEAAELHGLTGVDLHSLRHTFASTGAHVHSGHYAAFVAPLLGHGYQKRSITERYIHQNPEALRPAADAISQTIAALLGLGQSGRVVAFPRS